MQRRTLLRVGIGSAVVLALVGGGLALWQPGWREGRLGESARVIFRAVGLAVLDGLWPAPGPAREAAVNAWLTRLDTAIAGLPPAMRAELSQLLGLLSLGPGRQWLTGLQPAWDQATAAEVQQALQGMRMAPQPMRQQAYQALRDLTLAAYFNGPETWVALGYPGPADV